MSVISALQAARTPNIGFVVVGLFWGCFAAYVPDIKAQLGVSDGRFGLLLLAQGVGLAIAMLTAPLFDRLTGARAMQIAGVCFACCWVLPGLLTTPWVFALGMGLLGITTGLLDVIMNARVSALEARHARGLMNASHGMFSLAYMCAALTAAVLRGGEVPPLQALTGFAVLGVALSLALYMVPPDAPDDETEAQAASGMPWLPVVLCGLIVFVAFTSEATVETWSAIHVERNLGGTAAEGALGPAALGLMMALGRFGGQALTDRLRDRTVVIGASILAAAGAMLAALAPTPVVAYLGFGTLGLGVSVIGPLGLALVGQLVRARHRTNAISKAALLGFSGFLVAPALMGGLSELAGLRVAYGVVTVFILTAIPLALWAYSMKSPSKSDGT